MYSLKNFFAETDYKSSLFTEKEIFAIEKNISTKNQKTYIKCLIRQKDFQLKPEEAVRQLFLFRLINSYGYKTSQIKLEDEITFGREKKRADIVIYETEHPTSQYIIVEVKKPKLKDGKEQLKSYCNATGATIGVWTNGESISFYHRKDPNYFEDIPDIPKANQKLKDILLERWTIDELIAKDKLLTENKSLSNLIREMEDEVLANAGVDVFEEVFKLIYTKLYDEKMSANDKKRVLQFRNYGETDSELKETIQKIFDKAKDKWQGVFAADEKIKLTPSHLAICVSSLQNVKLFNSNLEVIDEAFEYLMSKSQKGEKGQYFTPRYVIDMCVKMLNPKIFENMIDTAAGSCGFPVHTIFHVWKKLGDNELFTAEDKPQEFAEYVQKKIFAIDFDEKAVRVARTLNLIAGDGKTNVLWLNTLDYERWSEIMDEDWIDIYNEGWKVLKKLRAEKNDNSKFNFDIVMANPPFAGDIKESRIISKYELGKNSKGKYQSKVGRDILFIERNLNFLKPGGRMAIVLPQGRFNNFSDKYIRDFISDRCRILAVVGLHGNVFKPHTGTKTSVLFVQKWDDELCPKKDDYPIFFATMQKPSKDNSGEKIFLKNPDNSFLRDKHNHLIVDHDLFNHEGLTKDGIAEAFIEFAKKENLSFFDKSSFDELKYKNLLEELEISEIFFSHLNSEFRLDSEFFLKKFLHLENILCRKNFLQVDDFAFVTDGIHESINYDENSKINLISAKAPKENIFDLSGTGFISESQHKKNSRTALKENDVIISTVGTIGNCAVVDKNILPANSDRHVGIIRIKKFFKPRYLSTFLLSKFGRYQTNRNVTGNVQPNLFIYKLKELKIYFAAEEFQEKISAIVKTAHEKLKQAKEKYSAAEKILSEELGLENFKPSTKNIAVKNFSQSFSLSGRLDAEFYQPKYDDIEEKISANSIGKIKDFFVQVKKICDRKEKFYNYIEIGDINISTGDAESNLIATENLPDNAKIMTQAGDILISKVRPNRGAISILKENNFLVSGAFTVLRATKNFSTEVLQVLLRLPIYKNFLLKFNVGTSYPVIKDEDVLKLPLPKISEEVQEKISTLVEESFLLRAESKNLLDQAKILVERKIES